MVFNLSCRLLGDRAAAEELTQEVFLRVHRGLKTFRGESSHKTWIYRITLNAASNQRKRWGRRGRRRHVSLHESPESGGLAPEQSLSSASPDPERIARASETGRRIQAALDDLPPEFRDAVALRDIEGLSYQEIAAALGTAVGTVKSRIGRGRALLRDALEDLL